MCKVHKYFIKDFTYILSMRDSITNPQIYSNIVQNLGNYVCISIKQWNKFCIVQWFKYIAS